MHRSGLLGVTTAHLTAFMIAGVALVVLGLLAVLFVRWRKSRSDRAYFDALANEPYGSSSRPERPAFTMVDGAVGGGFAVTSLEPKEPTTTGATKPLADEPAADAPRTSVDAAPLAESTPAGDAVQAANEAMAKLDRLLGNATD